MDKILKNGSITKKTKTTMLLISIVSIFLGLIFFIINNSAYNAISNRYIYHYDLGRIKYIDSLIGEPGFHLCFYCDFWSFEYIYIALAFWTIALFFLIIFFMMHKMQITITDKRVYGQTYFGRSVDLPMDSISAVGSSLLNGITVSTSSGKVSFLFIEDSKGLHELLRQLLIDRQYKKEAEKTQCVLPVTSIADELKKYKELLDCSVITQEEFETKKNQLLGL